MLRKTVGAALLLLLPSPLAAAAFGLFQHGGRSTAQAGAFLARSDDALAVRANPAGLARIAGFHGQAGLDFQAPDDEFSTAGRVDSPEHVIQFPPAIYLAWKPEREGFPLAFGLGVDAPFWSIENWNTALFPGRFDTLRQKLALYEVRPAIAWTIDQRWSLGGAVRYLSGSDETSFMTRESFATAPSFQPREIESRAEATIDGFGFELGVQFALPTWGLGATLASGVALDGRGEMSYRPKDPFENALVEAEFDERFAPGPAGLDFELPPAASIGVWWSPRPALSLELDAVWNGWSVLDRTRIELGRDPYATPPPAIDRRRDWEDTLSLRMGAEWRFASGWTLGGGLALEPSPVPDATAEPGFPRGDATVVALGGGYDFGQIAFDLGYSLHFYADRDAALQGESAPIRGTFAASSQVFSISARWKR